MMVSLKRTYAQRILHIKGQAFKKYQAKHKSGGASFFIRSDYTKYVHSSLTTLPA